jgi:hypothetical protein
MRVFNMDLFNIPLPIVEFAFHFLAGVLYFVCGGIFATSEDDDTVIIFMGLLSLAIVFNIMGYMVNYVPR